MCQVNQCSDSKNKFRFSRQEYFFRREYQHVMYAKLAWRACLLRTSCSLWPTSAPTKSCADMSSHFQEMCPMQKPHFWKQFLQTENLGLVRSTVSEFDEDGHIEKIHFVSEKPKSDPRVWNDRTNKNLHEMAITWGTPPLSHPSPKLQYSRVI